MAPPKKNATRRLLFLIIGLIVLLVILAAVGRATGLFGTGNDAVEVETARAERRTLTQVVTASGKVQPEVEVKLSPDVSGEIIELRVREGDQVEKGDLLVRIRPDFYVAQVEQAEAGVLQAKANMAQRRADMLTAEVELNRQKALFEKNAIAESDYVRAQNQYEVAKAAYEAAEYAVQSAEARLREAREQLSKTAIYAPMSGTVSKLDVELGERVVGTSQFTGTEMMRIARLDQMELEVDVNENDVVNVALGDTARIEIDAYPEQTFRGVVTEIANTARTTAAGTQEQVTNFPVKIRILDPHNLNLAVPGTGQALQTSETPLADASPQFRPGMSGTVDIYTKTVFDVVAVPIQAVTVRDFARLQPAADTTRRARTGETGRDDTVSTRFPKEDLRKVVFLVENGKAKMVEVTTGITDDTHIEIKSGLSGGEEVIIGPYRAVSRTLEPGTPVRVKPPEQPGRRPLAAAN
ncbi:efflux RND transporter periplasmic adaptor subunit [Rhodocaloribacter litoris]|uniref:efflux RND transporter periplasmic adaptor subunit n=1 Tax=Rhodocaloribacter litoris TaxID=2558931 RepID=UPI0014240493|nr:efflux RND transporter periplasmic adaptor subunit [Rhodocaloribacter litoris]QXD16646.1 efflux RND transporter periplasmic adaptor subunit [Rhodocaloribacter litoris]GIV59354.1 MAG: RND transporter [Rhodothermaceae bacterium]